MRVLTFVGCCLLGAVGFPAPAQAATGADCFTVVTWNFTTPLTTTTVTNGSGSFTFTNTCASVVPPSTFSNTGTVAFTYDGNCVLASIHGNANGVLIGGTIAVFTTPVLLSYHFLVPANPCNQSGPTPGIGGATAES